MNLFKKVSVLIFFLLIGIQYSNSQKATRVAVEKLMDVNAIKISTDKVDKKEVKKVKIDKNITADDLNRIVKRKRSVRYYKNNTSTKKCAKIAEEKKCKTKK